MSVMINDSWTEGLTKKQQNLVVEYVLNEGKIFPGIGGYKLRSSAEKFLKSKKGRDAVRQYVEFQFGIRKEPLKLKLTKICMIRAMFNPADIIDAQGRFIIETENDLHKLGELAFCIDGIETKTLGFDKKTGKAIKETKIKLCDQNGRHKAIDFLAKIFDLFSKEEIQENLIGEKSVYEMSDDERDDELGRLLKMFGMKNVRKLITDGKENGNEK